MRSFALGLPRLVALPILAALVAVTAPAGPAGTVHAQALPASTERASTIIILVRHAEKATAPANDPVLDSAGMRRAEVLLDVVRDAEVRAVYVTQFARTRLTAQPVSTALGLSPIVVPASGPTASHVRAVADRLLAEQRGSTSLVIGHSNTVPLIVRALGGSGPDQLEDHEYDNLFIVTVPASGAVTTVRARYGPANPPPLSTPVKH